MSEQVPPTEFDEPDPERSMAEADLGGPSTTGVPAVDQVLADVDRLDDLPLNEHLGAFERAHDSLRAALDALPDVGASEHPGGSA
jgi:hypothetical protein